MSRLRAALVAAVILTLAAVPVASAQTVTESFTVNGTITVSGIPASLSYGALDAGQQSAVQTIDALVTANAAWGFDISGSDFTGPTSLSKSIRDGLISTNAGGTAAGVTFDAPLTWRSFGEASLTDPTPEATGPAGVSGVLVRTELRINVPGGTPAGAYSGTLTITVAAQ